MKEWMSNLKIGKIKIQTKDNNGKTVPIQNNDIGQIDIIHKLNSP